MTLPAMAHSANCAVPYLAKQKGGDTSVWMENTQVQQFYLVERSLTSHHRPAHRDSQNSLEHQWYISQWVL
jgi:hypothetical protein